MLPHIAHLVAPLVCISLIASPARADEVKDCSKSNYRTWSTGYDCSNDKGEMCGKLAADMLPEVHKCLEEAASACRLKGSTPTTNINTSACALAPRRPEIPFVQVPCRVDIAVTASVSCPPPPPRIPQFIIDQEKLKLTACQTATAFFQQCIGANNALLCTAYEFDRRKAAMDTACAALVPPRPITGPVVGPRP